MAQTNTDGVANNIAKITEYLTNAMDNVLVAEAKTNGMTANPALVDATARSKTIKLATVAAKGAGDYDAAKGWPMNSGSLTWEDYTLTYDRGTSFLVDALETAHSNGLASAAVFASEFLRTKMIPEIDAIRISKASKAAVTADQKDTTTPTKANVITKLTEALDGIYDRTGIDEGMTIYMNNSLKSILGLSSEFQRTKDIAGNGESLNTRATSINGNNIVFVPSARMYTDFTLLDGTSSGQTDGGFAPKTGANAVNFLIAAPNTAQGLVSYSNVTIVPKGQHTRGDGDFWAYRVYHDCIVPQNKVGGLYVSLGAAVQ